MQQKIWPLSYGKKCFIVLAPDLVDPNVRRGHQLEAAPRFRLWPQKPRHEHSNVRNVAKKVEEEIGRYRRR